MSTVDEAAAFATGAVDEVSGAAAEAAQSAASSAAGGPGDGIGPMELLLSTDPDLQPAQVQRELGLGPVGTHGYIMVRKMLSPILPSTAELTGTPAIVNGGYAAFYYFTAPDEEEDDEPAADAEPDQPSSSSSPAGWPDDEAEEGEYA